MAPEAVKWFDKKLKVTSLVEFSPDNEPGLLLVESEGRETEKKPMQKRLGLKSKSSEPKSVSTAVRVAMRVNLEAQRLSLLFHQNSVRIGGEGGIVIVSPWGDTIILRRMRLRTANALVRIGVPNNL